MNGSGSAGAVLTDEALDELTLLLLTPVDNERTKRRWDDWRRYVAEGGKATWPRDEFESLLDSMDEDRRRAAMAITLLRERLAGPDGGAARDLEWFVDEASSDDGSPTELDAPTGFGRDYQILVHSDRSATAYMPDGSQATMPSLELAKAAAQADFARCWASCRRVPPAGEPDAAGLLAAASVVANACADVTSPGRFSRSVDPVRWVRQLEAHLRAAIAQSERAQASDGEDVRLWWFLHVLAAGGPTSDGQPSDWTAAFRTDREGTDTLGVAAERGFVETVRDHGDAPARPSVTRAGLEWIDDHAPPGASAPSPSPEDVAFASVRRRRAAEERIMREYRWGNLTVAGVANHLRRAGFKGRVAFETAKALEGAGTGPSP